MMCIMRALAAAAWVLEDPPASLLSKHRPVRTPIRTHYRGSNSAVVSSQGCIF